MIKIITAVLVCLFTISSIKANAVTTNELPSYNSSVPKVVVTDVTKGQKLTIEASENYKTIIGTYAKNYDVSEALLTHLVMCESSFNRYALNDNPGIEYSVGLAQINLLAHKNITLEQAQNPDFAIKFIAEHVASGDAPRMWVNCYNKWLSTSL